MANVLINDLVNAGTLTDSMQFEVDTGGTTSNKVIATVVLAYMQSNIDHDSLGDFVANEHIDHTGVTLTAGTGLSGGGDISSNRTFNLDVNGLTPETLPTSSDTFPFYDSTVAAVRKCEGQYLALVHNHDSDYAASSHNHAASDVNSGTFTDARIAESSVTQHVAAIDHDSTLNFVGNEHIDHTSVTLTAGTGISGGGDISTNRTFNLDVTGLTNENAPTSSDEFAFYDTTATAVRKCQGQYLNLVHNHDSSYSAIGHDHDSDYAALSHTHATTDVTSGTFADARISESSVTQHVGAIDHDSALNFVGNEHINHTSVTLTAGTGISGGGDISANRTFNLDITGLTNENAPTSSDEFAFYDATATALRKCQGQYLNLTHNHDSDYSPLLLEETTEKTTNYTMVLGDASKVVWMNGSSLTLTVPTNASVAYSIGTVINVYNSNSTTLTIQGDTGVTVRNAGTIPQYSEASLRKRGTNEWVLVGDIT